MTTAYLEKEGNGALFWPDEESAAHYNRWQYSKHHTRIKRLIKQLFFRLNQQQHRNNKYKNKVKKEPLDLDNRGRNVENPIDVDAIDTVFRTALSSSSCGAPTSPNAGFGGPPRQGTLEFGDAYSVPPSPDLSDSNEPCTLGVKQRPKRKQHPPFMLTKESPKAKRTKPSHKSNSSRESAGVNDKAQSSVSISKRNTPRKMENYITGDMYAEIMAPLDTTELPIRTSTDSPVDLTSALGNVQGSIGCGTLARSQSNLELLCSPTANPRSPTPGPSPEEYPSRSEPPVVVAFNSESPKPTNSRPLHSEAQHSERPYPNSEPLHEGSSSLKPSFTKISDSIPLTGTLATAAQPLGPCHSAGMIKQTTAPLPTLLPTSVTDDLKQNLGSEKGELPRLHTPGKPKIEFVYRIVLSRYPIYSYRNWRPSRKLEETTLGEFINELGLQGDVEGLLFTVEGPGMKATEKIPRNDETGFEAFIRQIKKVIRVQLGRQRGSDSTLVFELEIEPMRSDAFKGEEEFDDEDFII